MSFLQYNGVQMGLIQTRQYRQETVPVGQDIKGQRHTLTVHATVARRTLGLIVAAVNVADGGFADGAQVLIALRDRLMVPRKALRFDVGNRTFVNISSVAAVRPGVPDGTALDSELGPKPLACNVLGFNSVGSALVEFTVQWFVLNECPDRNGIMAVLAMIWKVDEAIDEDFYFTRVYQGEIHFDPLVVGPAGTLHPDAIKHLLLPPLARGFHRVGVDYSLSEDGYSMRFRVKDKQPRSFVNDKAVTRMTASHSIKVSTPHPRDVAQSHIDIANMTATLLAVPEMKETMSPLQWAMYVANLPSVGAAKTAAALGISRAETWSAIPECTHTVTATAFGAPASLYSELTRAARVVCLFRLMQGTLLGAPVNGPLFQPAYGGTMEHTDLSTPTEKASQVTMTWQSRPNLLTNFAVLALAWGQGRNTMPTLVGPYGQESIIQQSIKMQDGQEIPANIQALVRAGTLGQNNVDWGWDEPGFASGMMSHLDGGVRTWFAVADRANLLPFQGAYLQAIQNECAYKEYVDGLTGLRTTPVFTLP